jgi:superfamily II DNA or RNA helicase
MADIQTEKVNEVYTRVTGEPSVLKELSEYFTFEVPDAKFSPQFKKRHWDGFIRLYNLRTKQLYSGLLRYLFDFCKERGYTVAYDPNLILMNNFSVLEAEEYIKTLNIHSQGKPLAPRDYQVIGFAKSIRYKRLMLVSPTASGKSYIIYCFMRYLLQEDSKRTGLLIVPTTSLVEQMVGDFKDYSSANGFDVEGSVQKLYQGFSASLLPSTRLLVSTWQSLYTLPKDFFLSFSYVIGDEAHTFKAKCVGETMKNCELASYRLATTGTTDEEQVNNLMVEGLFGPITKTISTKEMMDCGYAAQLAIKSLVLKHPPGTHALVDHEVKLWMAKSLSKAQAAFLGEVSYIIGHEPRNRFIRNLTLSLQGNSLLLFQFVEKHGQILYDMIKEKLGDSERKIFFIHGGTETEQRESIRAITENETDAILVASYGVFSTGINIRNLHNVIFASPTKSKKRTLQSIGRSLRLSESKSTATLYDIADDFRLTSEDKANYTLKHYATRMIIYLEEKFKVSHYTIPLKG